MPSGKTEVQYKAGARGAILERLVLDANIFFDLDKGQILGLIFRLDCEYAVTDFVADELKSLRVDYLKQLGLQIMELDGGQIEELQGLRATYPAPGIKDLSALVLAHTIGCRLVTRDGALGAAARAEGVTVLNTLELIDEMVDSGILSPADAADALEEILRRRPGFPRAESQRRIHKWRG